MASGTPKKVLLNSSTGNKVFNSLTEASLYLECSRGALLNYIASGNSINGYYVDYLFTGTVE